MAKKLMIMPSGRSRYLKDDNMKLIYKSLVVLSVVMVALNYYLYAPLYAIKLILMIVLSVIATRETEILFYTHEFDCDRSQAKELIVKSYPKITALIYVLLIPVGTPLWLVVLGAILATLLGKLLFGGFHHMIFHSSLVGVIIVTLGWQQLVDGVAFMTSFDNYILTLLFDHPFFNETLRIGGMFDPSMMSSALQAMKDGVEYALGDVILGVVPGIVGSGLVLVGIFVFLIYKKAINYTIPVTLLSTFFVGMAIISVINSNAWTYPIYQLFSGSILFVTIYVTTDPITTPIPFKGKIVFGVIAAIFTMFIRLGWKYEEGIIFGVLFMSMLTPMLNTVFKEKAKVKTPVVKREAESNA